MTLGSDSIAELAIADIGGGSAVVIDIGCLDIQASLLWDLDPQYDLLWDLDPDFELLWDLDPQAYIEEDNVSDCTVDIGATVTLTTKAIFGGAQVDASYFALQIMTPNSYQWPDISGTEFTYNSATQRYEYRYHIRGDYAQAGVHYFRFKVVDEANQVTAAKWKPLEVEGMPFTET